MKPEMSREEIGAILRKRWVVICGLCFVLVLGAYLRLSGIRWGLTAGYSHDRSFQPDEFVSLRGLLPIDLRAGKLKAPAAYFEGTFNYYLWDLPIAVKELLESRRHQPTAYSGEELKFALLSGRLMTVFFDLLTTAVVFLIIEEAGGSSKASILGPFFYSVVPMQVIYAHFMRPHVLSNLLFALVFWQSLCALKQPFWWRFLVIGLLAGLSAATRYPIGIVLSIPILVLLFKKSSDKQTGGGRIFDVARLLIRGPIWWLGAGAILGLFLGHPYSFIDPGSVYHEISTQTFKYVPKDAHNFSHLLPLWNYVSVLVPYAMFPSLWIIAYGGAVYLCFRRRWRPVVIPLLVFFLLYVYPMAKSYLGLFARQVLLLVPGLCVIMALAIADLWEVCKRSAALRIGVITASVLLTVPSLFFDLAYVYAMEREDVRTHVRRDLKADIGNAAATINVHPGPSYFYTAMPAAEPLRDNNITIALQDETSPADYLVVGFERPLSDRQLAFHIRNVEKTGNFKYIRDYYSPPFVFGRKIDLSRFPPDMIYPFPTILLFRATAKG